MGTYLEIDYKKLKSNIEQVVATCKRNGISVAGVTKGVCGDLTIGSLLAQSGVVHLADARLENLKAYKALDIPKMLLRVPDLSEVDSVIEFSDISLNSELEVIMALEQACIKKTRHHQIVLMVDLGEWREGILEKNIPYYLEKIFQLEHIILSGIGVTFTCINGVIPSIEAMKALVDIKAYIKETFNHDVEIVSGGNSSTYYLVEGNNIPQGINHIRLGEVMLLGRETAYGKKITSLKDDVFVLKGEIVELKSKPTLPIGKIGLDAFGRVPIIVDQGITKRVLISIGAQDVDILNLKPLDEGCIIMGSSSDYVLVNIENSEKTYKLGGYIEFSINYGGLMALFTSQYIKKVFVD